MTEPHRRHGPAPADPAWRRTVVGNAWTIDTHRSGWLAGVVWMATIPRGDGTYAVEVGRTRTRWGANRAGLAALRRLWLQVATGR